MVDNEPESPSPVVVASPPEPTGAQSEPVSPAKRSRANRAKPLRRVAVRPEKVGEGVGVREVIEVAARGIYFVHAEPPTHTAPNGPLGCTSIAGYKITGKVYLRGGYDLDDCVFKSKSRWIRARGGNGSVTTEKTLDDCGVSVKSRYVVTHAPTGMHVATGLLTLGAARAVLRLWATHAASKSFGAGLAFGQTGDSDGRGKAPPELDEVMAGTRRIVAGLEP